MNQGIIHSKDYAILPNLNPQEVAVSSAKFIGKYFFQYESKDTLMTYFEELLTKGSRLTLLLRESVIYMD
jgi:hypothetical protein